MKTVIKREQFKGKYYMTYRQNGKIVSRKRWSSKAVLNQKTKDYDTVDKETAFKLFKKNESFSTRKKTATLVNVVEHSNIVKGRKVPLRIRNKKNWQYQVTLIAGNKEFTARSDNSPNESLDVKRDKAYERALGRLNRSLNKSYESNEATTRIARGEVKVKEEVVYYAKK